MEPTTDPGVTAPPAEPVAPATTPAQPSTGSEPVTNTDGKPMPDNLVPFDRFQKANDTAKAAEERAAQLESELETLRQQQVQTPTNPDDEVDPDVLDLVKKSAAKLGFVSKEDLDSREARIQVQQDINDLTSQYKDSGIVFDGKKVIDYAKANGMPLGSKKSLDAVYKEMNYDNIIEAQRKAAVDAFQQGAKSGAEKPGSKGAQAPTESKPGNLRDRIKAAREKSGVSVI